MKNKLYDKEYRVSYKLYQIAYNILIFNIMITLVLFIQIKSKKLLKN